MKNTRKAVCLLAGLALLVAGTAIAVRPPAEDATRPGPYSFEIAAPIEPLDVVENGFVNRTSGGLATLINQNAGPYAGTPEQAARAYLRENAPRFALSHGGSDLVLDGVAESPVGLHARFHQAVNGVRVWRADVVVSLDPTGTRVQAVANNYDPILAHAAPRSAPSLSAASANAIARAAIGISGEPIWIGPESETLWIVREQDLVGSPAHLAWRVILPVHDPMGDWEVFVNAADASIIRLADQILHVDGTGFVFDPDPLTTAEVNYGGAYADNNDADTPELNAQRFLKTLRDLTFTGGVYHLRGPYIYLLDFEAPWDPPATSPDPDGFRFTRNPQGFEDALCYFHIDQNQRYIQSLGFNNIQNGPIQTDPHGLNGADNSHYIPSSNRMAFGDGGVDDAEDVDVVLHEYGHAIQRAIVNNWGGGHQGAMGEGFGDYWAGSYSAMRSLFRWFWVFNWDGHNPFWGGRVLNSPKHYPENLVGQVHSDGEIWSAPWMQIYFECGRTVTDTDILQHHYYQGGSATMAQAAAFAMQADVAKYEGLHAGSLDEYFTLRGFFTPTQYDVPALTHTPLGDQTTGGPYPVTVTIQSTSAIVAGSVKVRYTTGQVFNQEAVLNPTGNPNEWAGAIPGQGGNVTIRYYLVAKNAAGWTGAHPRGAEFLHHSFNVGPLTNVVDLNVPASLALFPATPNPFNPKTAITFALPAAGDVRLAVHDVAGRLVRTLAAETLPAATHRYDWDGTDENGNAMPTGLYFARLEADGKILTSKLVMAK